MGFIRIESWRLEGQTYVPFKPSVYIEAKDGFEAAKLYAERYSLPPVWMGNGRTPIVLRAFGGET